MYSIYALVFAIFHPAHGLICTPTLLDSMPDKEHFKQIECEISTCSSVSQLRFEKLLYKQKQWIPVYEKFNETYHHSLDTKLSQYSLRGRSDYTDFDIKHVLYINPPTLEDQGQWRCVVFDITGVKHESKAMDINIYVTPPENLRIVPNNVELYTNQTAEFVCMADGIHPVPDVLWIVGGTGQSTGMLSNKQHGDGLWSVMNTIKLSFDKIGVIDLHCTMKTNERGQWMQNQIQIHVKANLCTPDITEGSHSKKELDGHLYLKCDISTCTNIAKVIFEKTDVHQITQWKPVFEGIDTSHYSALDTGDDYTLKQRNGYSVFATYHVLYIRPFTIKDTGRWRCVIHHNNKRTESKDIDINLAALCTPVIQEGRLSRKRLNGHLYLECDISECERVSRVVFEKTGVKPLSQWTPVFEGIDETHYAAVDTGEDYTLKQRNKYFSSPTYHLLYIKHLTTEDFGEWRCVLHDNRRRAESKAIRILSVDGPHLTIKLKNPNAVAKYGETFTCKIDGIYTEPAFEWTVTSSSTSEKYNGNTTASKQRDDGLWYAYNVVKLNFSNVGQAVVKCSVTTKNGDPLNETHVTVDIKDKIWKNIYTLLACLLLVVIVIAMFIMVFVREGMQKGRDSYARRKQGPFLRSAPLCTEWTKTIQLAANTCSIWRANESDYVFFGEQNRASITVIDDDGIKTNYHFLTGTGILHGLSLSNIKHMLNVYDQNSNTYSIHCVCIDLRSLKKRVIPQYTLNLNYSSPGCIFRVYKSNVGVYSYLNRVVEVFNMNDVSSNDSNGKDETESKLLTGLPVELIKLTGYTGHECDMLDTNRNGQICVSSYINSDVYIYAPSGEFITTITGSKLYAPVHIQCFSGFSLAVVDRVGKIHHFDKKLSKIVIALGENMIVKAAVFTKTKLWIIDGKDCVRQYQEPYL